MRRCRGVDGALVDYDQAAVADVAPGARDGLRDGELVSGGRGKNVIAGVIRQGDRSGTLNRGGGAVYLQFRVGVSGVQRQSAVINQGALDVESVGIGDFKVSVAGDLVRGAVELCAAGGYERSGAAQRAAHDIYGTVETDGSVDIVGGKLS